MSAALGVVQMQRIEGLLARRSQVAGWYNQRLVGLDWVTPPVLSETTSAVSWFVYVARISAKKNRDTVAQRLKNAGIPVRPYFSPIHLQPYMMKLFGYQPGDFPVTEDLGERSLALPFSGVMTESQVEQVCTALHDALK
jgi:dTDP-4-amino-4,6-dideoxygalactose transaminase